MSDLLLERYCYSEIETEGRLYLPEQDDYLYTLERPWIEGSPGGLPFESCVPDGAYELIPHTRPNGDKVYALRNPDLHVYYTREERGDQSGRYLILLHAANWIEEIVGCIAPGLVRTIAQNKRMVRSSREAMRLIMSNKRESIVIKADTGTQ